MKGDGDHSSSPLYTPASIGSPHVTRPTVPDTTPPPEDAALGPRARTRAAIRAALLSAEFVASSDRAVAAHVGCDHKTVARARARLLDAGELEPVAARVGLDGKTYTSPNAPRATGGGARGAHVGTHQRNAPRATGGAGGKHAPPPSGGGVFEEVARLRAELEEVREELETTRRTRDMKASNAEFFAGKVAEVSDAFNTERLARLRAESDASSQRRRAESAEANAAMWRQLANAYQSGNDSAPMGSTGRAELKSAYRALAKVLHTDTGPFDDAAHFQALRTLAAELGL